MKYIALLLLAGCSAPHGYLRAGQNSDDRWVSQALVIAPLAPDVAAAISRASPVGLSASKHMARMEFFADGLAADDFAGRTLGVVEARAFAPMLDLGPVALELFVIEQWAQFGVEARETTQYGIQLKF